MGLSCKILDRCPSRGASKATTPITITKTRTVILEQRERIKFLLHALNNVYLHPSTTAAASDFILSVLLADGGNDDDDDDDDVDDLGRLHSVSIVRFDVDGDDNNEDGDDDDNKD